MEMLSRTLGTTLEWMLCDLFSQHHDASRYWVDGVLIDYVTLQTEHIVIAKGRAWCGWCADTREQWQIPSEVTFRFSHGQGSPLECVAIRAGNASVATLGDHRSRSITKLADPQEWLLEFDVGSATSLDGKTQHAG